MSKGLGQLQRFILEGLNISNRGQAFPSPMIAREYAQRHAIPETPHLRASVRRAIHRLAEGENIQARDVKLPTRVLANGRQTSWRWTSCASTPDLERDAFAASALHSMEIYLEDDFWLAVDLIAEAVEYREEIG